MSTLTHEIQEIINDVGEDVFTNALQGTTFQAESTSRAEAVHWVLSRITSHRRPGYMADCIALATGMYERENITQTDIARRHGFTRANVSRTVTHIQEQLAIKPHSGNKSESARESYRKTNQRTP